MESIIGKKLDGRYLIQEIIGVGGMAVVYKAYDGIDDRVVAVKVLKEEYLTNDEFRRRFKNESKAVAVLSHPNIVKVYDVSLGDRIQYIVMEYIDGITLKEYIEQQNMLTWKEAVHFTVQILRALQHAHENGIVHRDIKPQNIMLLEDGTIKVTDFGIARFAHSETKTMTDKAIGSVHYISPEQARGGHTDQKSDIYSVGVMLFEMLTGKLPFEADSAVSVAIMQMQQTPRKPRDLNPEIPEGLEDITLRAMQKDPEQRYHSAAEMLEDIISFKRNPSIHFEYKYFVDESPTKYINAIKEIKGGTESEMNSSKKGSHKEYDNDEEPERKSNLIPVLAGIAAALVLAIVLMIIVVLATKNFFNGSDNVTVPTLIGQDFDKAQSNTAYTNLIVIKQENTQYSEKPKGEIISQDPVAGKTVKKNSVVKVVVSSGQRTITVPDVYGEEKTQAETELKNEGFTKIVETSQYDSNTAQGYVISTTPARGESVNATDTITVVISLGNSPDELKSVPDIRGKTADYAKRLIEDAGLVVGTVTHANDPKVPKGCVISQTPMPATQASAKSSVSYVISDGPQQSSSSSSTVTMPKLVGKSLADAQTLLNYLGLNYSTSPDNGSTEPKDTVTYQSVAEGTQVAVGNKVILGVSTGGTSSSKP